VRVLPRSLDPLGLALENLTPWAYGAKRSATHPLDAAGKLITGETDQGVRDLKRITKKTNIAWSSTRCLSEKLLTLRAGTRPGILRVETVDRIVDRLDKDNGAFPPVDGHY